MMKTVNTTVFIVHAREIDDIISQKQGKPFRITIPEGGQYFATATFGHEILWSNDINQMMAEHFNVPSVIGTTDEFSYPGCIAFIAWAGLNVTPLTMLPSLPEDIRMLLRRGRIFTVEELWSQLDRISDIPGIGPARDLRIRRAIAEYDKRHEEETLRPATGDASQNGT